MSYWTDDIRRDAIAAIRRICDFLEANPDFNMPSSFSGPVYVQNSDNAERDSQTQREWFLRNAKLLGPDARPEQDEHTFYMLKDFGGVSLCLMSHRSHLCDARTEIAERVVKEERTIYECPSEFKALGFTDPGEVELDGWEKHQKARIKT